MTTTLLAVDDSKTMRKVMEITFSGDEFRLVLCANPGEAMSKLSERPNVALVDANLDGQSGYDLCQKLKAAQPGLSVIILSSKQQPYDRALGGQVGADDFADKPFDTQQLLDKVNTLAKKAAGAPAPVAAPAAIPQHAARAPTLSYGAAVAPVAPAPAPVAAAPAAPMARQTAPGLAAGPAFASRAPTALGAAVPTEVRAAPTPPTAPLAAMASPSRAPAPVAPAVAAVTNGADFAQKLGSLGLTPQQVEGVLSLSREVVERVVWEVVPTLAETLIREEIARLTKE
ncbi:MAG TPA: response regulator [Polyangiaceae bacterium]|nr:response regulator [Polyangiaceae bacterium]